MGAPERGAYITIRDYEDLHDAGSTDEARHNEKLKEALKGNLQDIIADESIITADPKSKKLLKVPMKSLDIPRIRFRGDGQGAGSGSGQPGDIIGGQPGQGDGPGKGKQAGDIPGIEYYETEIDLEELSAMVFEDLGLPNLQQKVAQQNISTEKVVIKDIRPKRTMNNLDLMRTAYANIHRNAASGKGARIHGIRPDDYRVRTHDNEIQEENSAVVLAMADVSGSMGVFEKYITRSVCWWALKFLRTKYPKVDVVFLAHHTEAWETDEDKFFDRGESGGTKVSAVNELALDIITTRYPTSKYNVYPMHFSDGDNWGEVDNAKNVELLQRMIDMGVSQYAYNEIQEGGRKSPTTLMTSYRNAIKDPRFCAVEITRKEDVYPALKLIFDPKKQLVLPAAS